MRRPNQQTFEMWLGQYIRGIGISGPSKIVFISDKFQHHITLPDPDRDIELTMYRGERSRGQWVECRFGWDDVDNALFLSNWQPIHTEVGEDGQTYIVHD